MRTLLSFSIRLIPLLVLASLGSKPIYATEIPIQVGWTTQLFNIPFISLNICVPGTGECRRIDRILLDSGSVGLQVYRSALDGLSLPKEHSPDNREIALCSTMAGGTNFWGPMTKADLVFGDQTAKSVPVHVVDQDYLVQGTHCGQKTQEDYNGIIGLNAALRVTHGGTYFSCVGENCTSITPSLDLQLSNPIPYLQTDNNGYSISFPVVPGNGEYNVTGSLQLGVGTQAANRPASPKASCQVDSDSFFQINYRGTKYVSMIDTGTNSYALPLAADYITHCLDTNGDVLPYLCPEQPMDFPITLINKNGSTCASTSFTITANVNGPDSKSNFYVDPNLGENWARGASDIFLLGLPFFFGKRVYYIMDGKASPLGPGPRVAF